MKLSYLPQGLQLLLPCSCKYLKPPKQRLWHIVLKSVKAIGAVSNKTSDNVGTFKIAGKLQHIAAENAFKHVQMACLVTISYWDKLVQRNDVLISANQTTSTGLAKQHFAL